LFLEWFWDKYRYLKRYFPMLGEIDIFSEDTFDAWSKISIRGYESMGWKLVSGKEVRTRDEPLKTSRLEIDALNYALYIYKDLFLPYYFTEDSPTFLIECEMRRLVSKILKYALGYRPQIKKLELGSNKALSKKNMLFFIFKGFETSLRSFKPPHPSVPNEDRFKQDVKRIRSINRAVENSSHDLFEEISKIESIDSVTVTRTACFIVLKQDLTRDVFRKTLDELDKFIHNCDPEPVLLNPSLFRYLLMAFDPFLNIDLRENEPTIFGNNLLKDIPIPSAYLFIIKTLEMISLSILIFSRSADFFTCPGSPVVTHAALKSICDRALFVKLYLETGDLKPCFRENVQGFQQKFPHYCRKIEGLIENAAALDPKCLKLEWFKLICNLSQDIQISLEKSPWVQEVLKI